MKPLTKVGLIIGAGSTIHAWSALGVVRILLAPLFAPAFLLGGLIAPFRAARIALFIAMGSEATVLAGGLLLRLPAFRP